MNKSTIKNIEKCGLNPDDFISELPDNLQSHVVVVNPEFYGFFKDYVLFRVVVDSHINCLWVEKISDGTQGSILRSDIIAVSK